MFWSSGKKGGPYIGGQPLKYSWIPVEKEQLSDTHMEKQQQHYI